MRRFGGHSIIGVATACIVAWLMSSAGAQDSPGDPSSSALGESPGATGAVRIGGSRGSQPVIPVGPGPSYPRVPRGITQPPESFRPPAGLGIESLSPIPESELPITRGLAIAAEDELDGPPNGLSIDQAIDRVVQLNLELRAQAMEVSKARADVVTAGLRGNPLIYMDSALVPYGSFDGTAGGPTQYDFNITLPIDLNQKRKRRVEAATCALKVTEAQFQDAVRMQIDNLYTAWIDVLSARVTIRSLETGLESLAMQRRAAKDLVERGEMSQSEVNNIEIQRESTDLSLLEAKETYDDAKRTLAALLHLPLQEAESYQNGGLCADWTSPRPPSNL